MNHDDEVRPEFILAAGDQVAGELPLDPYFIAGYVMTDVRYALAQLRNFQDVSRAIDALERVEAFLDDVVADDDGDDDDEILTCEEIESFAKIDLPIAQASIDQPHAN